MASTDCFSFYNATSPLLFTNARANINPQILSWKFGSCKPRVLCQPPDVKRTFFASLSHNLLLQNDGQKNEKWEKIVNSILYGDKANEPDSMQSSRKGRDDDWYEVRRVFCCSCKRPVRASKNQGTECEGCHRWYHDSCTPTTASSSRATLQKQPKLFFHCAECKAIHDRLQEQLMNSKKATLTEDRSLEVLDLKSLRPMWRNYRKEQRLLEELQTAGGEKNGEDEAAKDHSQSEKVSTAAKGLGSLTTAATLLRTATGATTSELLENDVALLLRARDTPVSVLALILHGPEHARVAVMATDASHRRHGHCRALVSEAEKLLARCGVQRLVLWQNDQDDQHNRGGEEEEAVRKVEQRLGYRPLNALDLSGYKANFPAYHRDLVRGMAFVSKDLPAAK